jgi:hypothetical protein
LNRALSKAERNTKSEKTKRRPRKIPYSKEYWAEDNAVLVKTNQGGVLHVEREATGPIAVQIINNHRKVPVCHSLILG